MLLTQKNIFHCVLWTGVCFPALHPHTTALWKICTQNSVLAIMLLCVLKCLMFEPQNHVSQQFNMTIRQLRRESDKFVCHAITVRLQDMSRVINEAVCTWWECGAVVTRAQFSLLHLFLCVLKTGRSANKGQDYHLLLCKMYSWLAWFVTWDKKLRLGNRHVAGLISFCVRLFPSATLCCWKLVLLKKSGCRDGFGCAKKLAHVKRCSLWYWGRNDHLRLWPSVTLEKSIKRKKDTNTNILMLRSVKFLPCICICTEWLRPLCCLRCFAKFLQSPKRKACLPVLQFLLISVGNCLFRSSCDAIAWFLYRL